VLLTCELDKLFTDLNEGNKIGHCFFFSTLLHRGVRLCVCFGNEVMHWSVGLLLLDVFFFATEACFSLSKKEFYYNKLAAPVALSFLISYLIERMVGSGVLLNHACLWYRSTHLPVPEKIDSN